MNYNEWELEVNKVWKKHDELESIALEDPINFIPNSKLIFEGEYCFFVMPKIDLWENISWILCINNKMDYYDTEGETVKLHVKEDLAEIYISKYNLQKEKKSARMQSLLCNIEHCKERIVSDEKLLLELQEKLKKETT